MRHRAFDLLMLLGAFAGGTGAAELLGANNTGTALGVGQVTFAAALAAVLIRR